MISSIDDFRKKLLFRSSHRGTKEMDKLLGSFTKKYIDQFNEQELTLLCDLLDFDDENLYKFNQGQNPTIQIELNKVSEMFKNYNYASE